MDSPARNTPRDLRGRAVLHHHEEIIVHSVVCEDAPTGEPVFRFSPLLVMKNEDINTGIAIPDQFPVMVPC